MHEDLIGYERRDAIAVLTLNRPDKLNAINAAMIEGLHRALDTAEADDGVRVVVVAGAGRAFSSGFDLDMETGGEGRPDPLAVRRALENDFRIIMRFWDSPEGHHRRRAPLLPRQRDGARPRLRPHDRRG